ncbi:hypothetical protein D9M68_738040 [compost metagenome]
MAKVTEAFDGVPDGSIYPRRFQVGEVVAGDLATVAMNNGWAEEEEAAVDPLAELKAAVTVAGAAVGKAKKAHKDAVAGADKEAAAGVLKDAEAGLVAAKDALKAAS